MQDVKVSIRQFNRTDIPKKVEWINNPDNNRFLHYELPLSVEKTEKWYDSHLGQNDRYDAIIEADGKPVGLIGLLNIDRKNSKAEFYLAMGETAYKGKGIAKKASSLMLEYGFTQLGLNRIYFYTECENIVVQRLLEKVGYVREGCLKSDIYSHGTYTDRYVYGCLKGEWEAENAYDRNPGSGRI